MEVEMSGIDKNQNVIKLKGQNKNINPAQLEGLRQTEQNKEFFIKFDADKNGKLDKTESDNMSNWLKDTAGNSTLSEKEVKKAAKKEGVFEAISTLANQQAARNKNQDYTETNGNKTTFIHNDKDNPEDSYSYIETLNEDKTKTRVFDSGESWLIYENGNKDVTAVDGTITKYEKQPDGSFKRIETVKDGLTTTYPSENKTVTKNSEGKIVSTTEIEDGKEIRTDYEYQDEKTILREHINGKSGTVTVSTQKDGHTVDTKYLTEEDYKNEKPSEEIIDAQNPTLKKTSKFTYEENGNVKIETTDSAGNTEVKYKDSKGNEIDDPNIEKTTTHTVEKGETITKIVKDALKAQGIDKPTKEQLKQAKTTFLELNKDKVKTYNGKRNDWKGNKFFYPDDVVQIPDFTKLEDLKPVAKEEKSQDSKALQQKELEQRKNELQKKLGQDYIVEIDENGNFVVKNKKGETLPEATKKANSQKDTTEIDKTMKEADKDKNNKLNKEEYKAFIINQLKQMEIKITDSNREKIETLIDQSFNSIDKISKDDQLDREELEKNMNKAVEELASKIDEMEK